MTILRREVSSWPESCSNELTRQALFGRPWGVRSCDAPRKRGDEKKRLDLEERVDDQVGGGVVCIVPCTWACDARWGRVLLDIG